MAKESIDLASMLRHRITLQRAVHSFGAGGDAEESWEDVAEVWAAIEPLGGSERLFGERMAAEKKSRITIRHRDGVDTAMRVVFGERNYAIRSVTCPDEAQERLVLSVEENE